MSAEWCATRCRVSIFAVMSLLLITGLAVGNGSAAQRPSFDNFDSYLARGYREVWKIGARNGGGPQLAAHFRERGALAAAGHRVVPLDLSEVDVSAWTMREAGIARLQLLSRLDGGARQRQPLLAAIAQVNFDCWISPLPKRLGVPDGDECRRRFYFAFAGLRSSQPPGLPSSPPATQAVSAGMPPASDEHTARANDCPDLLVEGHCLKIAFTGPEANLLISVLRAGADPRSSLASIVAPLIGSPPPSSTSVDPPASNSAASSSPTGSGAGAADGTANAAGDSAANASSAAGSVVAGAAGSTKEATGGAAGGAVDGIGSTANTAGSAVGGAVSSVGNSAGTAASTAGTAVGGAVSSAGNAAGTAASTAGSAVGGAVSSAGNAAGTAASTAGSAVGGTVSSAGNAAGAAASTAGSAVGGAVNSAGNAADTAASTAGSAVGAASSAAGNAASAAAGALGGAVKGAAGALGGIGHTAGGSGGGLSIGK